MKKPQSLLKEIAAIQSMERGTLCRMGSGPYFNHQTWQDGRNRVRYVPKAEVAALRAALAGYRRFLTLTQQYADLVIQRTRAEKPFGKRPSTSARPKTDKD